MADLDDFARASSAFPDLDDIGGPPAGAPTGQTSFPSLDGDDDDDFGGLNDSFGGPISGGASSLSKPPTDIKVTGDDVIDKFEDQFPDIGGAAYTSPPVAQTPSFYQAPPSQLHQPVYGGPVYTPQIPEEEPEVIKKWRAEQEERIRARDAASEKKRQETISNAEAAIDQFYKEYRGRVERSIANNKREEEEYKSSLTDSLAEGTTWSRICDIVELQNSQSKSIARAGPGTSDLTRMKEVLLRLRREGEHAPGAAGY